MPRIVRFGERVAYCTECGSDVPLARASVHVTSKGHRRDPAAVTIEIDGRQVPSSDVHALCVCGWHGFWPGVLPHIGHQSRKLDDLHRLPLPETPVVLYHKDAPVPNEMLPELHRLMLPSLTAAAAQSTPPPQPAATPAAGYIEDEPSPAEEAEASLGEIASAPPGPPGDGAITEPVAAYSESLDVETLAADPARINVQIEVPTWLITMWDIGYRARGYDGTFARWLVELLTLHFTKCRGISLGIIVRRPTPLATEEER